MSSNSNVGKLAVGVASLVGWGAFAAYQYLTGASETKQQEEKKRLTIRIGTRESKLAMWQAEHVRDLLLDLYPHANIAIVGMTTLGDRDLNSALSNFSNKGVFTKELDVALLKGDIDIAVHCMKDLPTTLPDGIAFGAVLPRGDVEDALVCRSDLKETSLDKLPPGSVIGTSALRRVASIAKHYPHLVCKNVRGNVNTRLAKLDAKEYDALILARIGLERLGFQKRISQVLDSDQFGYAVGQGALAIVCRQGDIEMQKALRPLNCMLTLLACAAERGLLKDLQGGCKVPISVRTELELKMEGKATTLSVNLHGAVLSLDGKQYVDGTHSVTTVMNGEVDPAKPDDPLVQVAVQVGAALGDQLRKKGADKILSEIKG